MHIFLTGDRRIGKTTVIANTVDRLVKSGVVATEGITGFRTVWAAGRETAVGAPVPFAAVPAAAGDLTEALYILPYVAGDPIGSFVRASDRRGAIPPGARPVAMREADGSRFVICPEVFDEDGVAILRAAACAASQSCPALIVMDELGFMESGAPAFRDAVMRVLDGDIPVLGVLRKESVPFLDAVRNHPGARVTEVTKNNRDMLSGQLTSEIFHD
jgi:nucleoside-triphosphatase